ncbi:ABC transporter permease [Dactylosporangium sp. McL0621]|uniref:ABC transporter permease n=1 Tax=Dactylosporangium sp. McL0621 TaxID=3415678 RepID=UPI003CF188F8
MVRTALKGLLTRRRRLTLSGVAVVLGVMFVSGALVLTDTLGHSYEERSVRAYARTDVSVAPPAGSVALDAAMVDRLAAVPGVASATGVVSADGARLIGADGKVVASPDRPRLGVNWSFQAGLAALRSGRGPGADDEIAVDADLARRAGVGVGDRVGVLTLQPRRTFTVVGVFEPVTGQPTVAFTDAAAQRLMLGEPGAFSSVSLTAAAGVPPDVLRDRVAAVLGPGYPVRTGRQLGRVAAAAFASSLGLYNDILLGFAGVALFVGSFLILNTFAILVAQRTRELALLRSLGASRGQIVGSVLAEAGVVGLVSSAVGLGAGIAAGALLAFGAVHFRGTAGSGLDVTGVAVPADAVVAAFGVGLTVTVVAALIPALRATRVPPLAVLREVAVPDRPLTRLSVAGAVVLTAGTALLGLGLAGRAGDGPAAAIVGGVLLAFAGAALLTPIAARPVIGLLRRGFARSVPARLGLLNAGRNPRRTAITAAALMVAVALVSGVSTVFASAMSSVGYLVDDQVKAEFVVAGDTNGSGRAGFDPAVLAQAARLPQVRAVTGLYEGTALIGGQPAYVEAVTDLPALRDMLSLTPAAGTIGPLGDDQVIVDERNVTAAGPHVGDRITVRLPRGPERRFTLAGIYADTDLLNGWLLPAAAGAQLRNPLPGKAFVDLRPGADVAAAKAALTGLLASSPEIGVADRHEYVGQRNAKAGRLLTLTQILLALAVLIAVLGIVNTVALSVLERTRELGLLRAIGLHRAQTTRMISIEAMAISVFGAVLGVAVGAGLGAAMVRALRQQGVTALTLPWGQMAAFLGLAVAAGVLGSIPPAIRAARMHVLRAIAVE